MVMLSHGCHMVKIGIQNVPNTYIQYVSRIEVLELIIVNHS